jgi:hypothetical protein
VFIEELNGLLRKTPGITETPDKKNKK